MRRAIRTSVQIFADCFDPPGPIVEVGARYPPGFERLANLRSSFPGRTYVGCDIRTGPGVELLSDAEHVAIRSSSIGTMLLFEILEHLRHPVVAVAEAHRVLRPGGLLALSVPFNLRLHGFPTDYWRFTASGVHEMLSPFEQRVVFALGPAVKPSVIFAVAAKDSAPDFTIRRERFQRAIEQCFRDRWVRGHVSVFKERARDFFGLLVGRAGLKVSFFDPDMPGGYGR